MTGAHAKQPPTKIMNHPGVCAVKGCDRKYYAKLHCRMHWERLYTNGTTDRAHIEPGTPPAERLNRMSRSEGDCIVYVGHLDRYGYGQITVDSVPWSTHRLAYETYYGELGEDSVVRHKCDNPPCINPDHLEAGSFADNSRDRDERGRTAKGVKNGTSKLKDADVKKIRSLRSDGWTYSELASLFGVGPSTIGRVVTGTHWRHIS